MRYALIIIAFFFCTIKTDAQVYQAMPQAGYGPVKRMLIDSVLTIPIGLSQLRNITGGRDTAQIRYQKSDSSVYVYSGSTWIKLGTGGGGGGSADSTVFFTVYRADTMRSNIYARIVTTDSAVYFTKYRSDTMRANIYSYIKNVDSLTYFTKYRSDTMRANIYAAIPQPDTFFVKYPVRVTNDTIMLAQGFVDSVYNISSGDATRLVTTVYNNTGSTITKGSVVYINGRHSSNLPTIALAQANDEANSYKTFALVETDITTSNSGRVIQAGRINNLNLPTSTYTDGDILYLSPTVAGGYTTIKPLAPNHLCKLGSVVRAHPTLGAIEVKIENGYQLDELSDVQIAAVPADSTLLQFSRVDSLWHDRTITQTIGPYLNAKANIASPTFTGTVTVPILQLTGRSALQGVTINKDSVPITTTNRWGLTVDTTNNRIQRFDLRRKADTTGATFTGAVGIGSSPVSTALLDVSSTTQGVLIPRMTTSQRNAISTPASQLLVANTTTNTIDMYQNNNWSTIAGDYNDDIVAYRALGSTIQAGPVPGIGTIQTAITMFTGRGYWAAVYVKKPITITGAAWFQTIAGSYTAANYNGLALYSYSGGTLTLVDSSTRDNTIWTATTGSWNSKAFAGGTRTLSPGIYYVAAFYNNSAVTTNPQIGAVYSGTSTVGYTAPLTTNSARISGWETSITTPPSTKTMSSFTGQGIYLGLCLY